MIFMMRPQSVFVILLRVDDRYALSLFQRFFSPAVEKQFKTVDG